MPDPSIFTPIVIKYLPEPQASLLNGILFGIPLSKSTIFYDSIHKVGLLHIVVLSGMNITILAGFIGTFTANFGKSLSILLIILSVLLFIVFIHPQAPIVRAGIMGVLTFVAIYYGRRSVGFYSLLISALLIALIWPSWLKSLSFYLSYGATLGILLFSPSPTNHENSKSSYLKLFSLIKTELQVSLAAQFFTVPLIFIYFKEISFIAPLSNLFISFTIAPIMVFGFLTALLGKLHFALGLIPAYICYGLLTYVVFIIEAFSKLPFVFVKF